MKIINETGFFLKRKLLEFVRDPSWFFSGLITPLLYIALFSPLLKNISYPPLDNADVLDSFVPGILTILAFSAGMGAGWLVIWDLKSGVIERLRVTPASRFSIMLGAVLKDVITFFVPAVLVILVSSLFGFHINVGGLAALMVLLCLLTAVVSAWSASLGLMIKEIGGLAAVVTGLQLPLTLLSGALLPLSLAPNWLITLAHINPMYYTVEASRVLAAGNINTPETIKAFAVLIPLTIIVLWWATRIYRKAVA